MKYAQDIADATQEIFSSMVMLDVTPGEPFKRSDSKLVNSISGIIGLAGTIKGMLAIHLPNEAALAITTSFLGMDVEEIEEPEAVQQDFLGLNLKMPSEKNIKVGCATSKKQNLAFIVQIDVIREPFPVFDLEFFGGHCPHQGLEKASVGF